MANLEQFGVSVFQNKVNGWKARLILTYFKKKNIKNGAFLSFLQSFEVEVFVTTRPHQLFMKTMNY